MMYINLFKVLYLISTILFVWQKIIFIANGMFLEVFSGDRSAIESIDNVKIHRTRNNIEKLWIRCRP